jgi:acetyl-CoA carboxylase carboxyltransferase component
MQFNCTIIEGAASDGDCYTAKTTDYIILVKNDTNIAVNPCDPCRVVKIKNANSSTAIRVSAATCTGPTPGTIDGMANVQLFGYSNTTALSALELVGDGTNLWALSNENALQV